jgi:uncharacterized protein (TIGR02271 family)
MADHRTQDTIIPLVEEEVRIDKLSVVTGKVRVRTVTDTVEEMARATLEGREVEVVRVPINREVDAAPAVRTEGDVVIVPVAEEILVVEKRLVLKEELRLQPRKTEETVEVPVTLRKQRAVVERVGPEGPAQEEENQ